MSKKTKTETSTHQDNSIKFDQPSMDAYHKSIATVIPQLQSQMDNPFNNKWYNLQLQQNLKTANNINAYQFQSLNDQLRQRGISDSSPIAASMAQRQFRMNSGNTANAYLQSANNARQDYWNAASGLMNFRPLTTGEIMDGKSTQIQTTSGLGTWLPQVAAIGLGAAAGIATGGAGFANMLKGGLSGAAKGASGAFGGGGGGYDGGGGGSPWFQSSLGSLAQSNAASGWNPGGMGTMTPVYQPGSTGSFFGGGASTFTPWYLKQ